MILSGTLPYADPFCLPTVGGCARLGDDAKYFATPRPKPKARSVLYVGGPTGAVEATARIFEQRYLGIKVAITGGGFSNVLDKKIDPQIKDGRLEVDTVIFQTLTGPWSFLLVG